jgi:hypothetical protein
MNYRLEKTIRVFAMKNEMLKTIGLLTSLSVLVLLICWSFVGPAIGGTSEGGSDDPEQPPGEGEGEAESEAEAEGAESESESEAEAESEAESESESESESEAESESEEELDRDNDFIPDIDEPGHITDPFDWDSDDDNLGDGVENGATDPNQWDTDNDGL